MITDPLGDMADIIAAIIIMFLIPVLYIADLGDRLLQNYVHTQADAFLLRVDINQSIDESALSDLVLTAAAAGAGIPGRYEVEIMCSRMEYEPIYHDGIFTGEIKEYLLDYETDEILSEIHNRKNFPLRAGDVVYLELKRTGESPSQYMLGWLLGHKYGRSMKYELSVSGGL